MAARIRRYTLAAVALPFLLLAMSAIARAATITVDTLSPTSVSGHCNLSDAIKAANTKAIVQGCTAGTGTDTIDFSLSGTITLSSELPAIANTSPGSLTINGSGQSITVDGASTYQILSVNSGATLNLQFLTIEDGSVTGSIVEGGGIYNDGTLTVANSTLSNNQATGEGMGGGSFGGAIYNDIGATLTVTDSTFASNKATGPAIGNGGAITNNFGTVTITNSTFSANQATFLGGAIVNSGTLTATNSTFSGNSAAAGDGGGIFNDGGSATLKGTILAGSTPNNCNTTLTASYSIADDDTCFANGTNNNVVESSTGAVGLDPAGLAMNGGPTETIALEPNSEAIDFIPVADCTDQSSPTPLPVTTDQRGLPRPDPGNPLFCDAGAYELQTMPFVLAPNSERLQIARGTSPNSDQVNTAFTFTENGFPACDAGDNAFNGLTVVIEHGTCATLDNAALVMNLSPWVVHTVNHESYGTFFESIPPETISARMVALPTPAAPACGEWTINIEVAGADTAGFGNGPFALILSNPDGDTGCFDITNAIVGNQIPTPGHSVRRGVRRQTRR